MVDGVDKGMRSALRDAREALAAHIAAKRHEGFQRVRVVRRWQCIRLLLLNDFNEF